MSKYREQFIKVWTQNHFHTKLPKSLSLSISWSWRVNKKTTKSRTSGKTNCSKYGRKSAKNCKFAASMFYLNFRHTFFILSWQQTFQTFFCIAFVINLQIKNSYLFIWKLDFVRLLSVLRILSELTLSISKSSTTVTKPDQYRSCYRLQEDDPSIQERWCKGPIFYRSA